MPDEIIEELWKIKESIAREHGNDVRKIAAYLQSMKRQEHGPAAPGRSAVDVLAEASGQPLFKSAKDVDDYIGAW